MAILHRATLTPTKPELVTARLDHLGLGAGPVELIGGYRFDDPAGQVGVEGLIAVRGGDAFHVPVTYRDAPLDGADDHLTATMDHSALGRRWVYDAAHDPVAVACYLRALAAAQGQAELFVHDETGHLIEKRTPPVTVSVARPGEVRPAALVLVHRLESAAGTDPQGPALFATWGEGNSAIVALG